MKHIKLFEQFIAEATKKVGSTGQDYNGTKVKVTKIGPYKEILSDLESTSKDAAEMFKAAHAESGNSDTDLYYLTTVQKDSESLSKGDLAAYPVKFDFGNYWGIK